MEDRAGSPRRLFFADNFLVPKADGLAAPGKNPGSA
jgi:hypothetical protein